MLVVAEGEGRRSDVGSAEATVEAEDEKIIGNK